MSRFNRFTSSALRRLQYHRTVSAIRAMPPQTAQDLNMRKSDAKRIARDVVYGD